MPLTLDILCLRPSRSPPTPEPPLCIMVRACYHGISLEILSLKESS